ncbi:TspO/MBR family protein [Skermanella sp. TT6]|nr:TspO/MBR family protein [Skermanella sp. TT6]
MSRSMMTQSTIAAPGRAGSRGRSLIGLAAFVILVDVASATASSVTLPQIDGWYAGLEKPWFNPPDWLFGPVWTVLYGMMAVAGWLVWRDRGLAGARGPLLLFGLQLGLNILWSLIFFGMQQPGLAFAEISALWIAVAATMVAFWRVRPLAGWLFVPYLLWVSYAAVLNASVWLLNA